MNMTEPAVLLAHTATIVAAFVGNNRADATELPGITKSVHDALAGIANPPEVPPPAELIPAVPVKKSVTQDHIVCLEDGKKFRSLKRHIGTVYGLSPDEYRAKWGLPKDYPMVAPGYSEIRSKLAKDIGLGNKVVAAPESEPAKAKPGEVTSPKPKKTGKVKPEHIEPITPIEEMPQSAA